MAAAGLDMQISLANSTCAGLPHMASYMSRGVAQIHCCAKKEKVEHDIYAPLHACGVMTRDLAAEISENSYLDETLPKRVELCMCTRVVGAISRAAYRVLSGYVARETRASRSIEFWCV